MLKRKLGRTGIEVSEVGFGSWGIGGWGERDDTEAIRALQRAFDKGVTFYDTAIAYGGGHSEQLIGQALGKQRRQIVIASKVPPKNSHWPVLPGEPLSSTFPADWIIRCTEQSLKNLHTDYLDVQQLHAWTPEYLAQDEWYEAFLRLKKQGKVRAFGVSANDWDPYGTTDLVKSDKIDTVQVIYNIFEQRPAEKLLPAALEHNVGIIVRVPFEEGLLTGKMRPGYRFNPGDWRADWLTPERLAEAASRTDALTPFLAPDRPTLSALALKFCLSHPAVSTVIPGMRKVQNLEENVKVSDGKLLSAAELEALKAHQFVHGWAYPWAQTAN
jgi:aryl-alcohol dehydrogenase-like predicted oxidoreductase